ncbi:pyridoxal-phosphate dependent enzyme [Planosporangium thailandense]|uniref:Pyridoxal-phosphate dependent enzyme n=1 Tax=Planosporangium thailandense TaxID=765197 RepID=A0ABX0Y284_9ACTN|nr:pyridoxal-phosphate dependent enzyme [Planosporangium thailandense]NJC72464.1 pyridoxal-phosphate dependent enzyme [Planosporangium thailandense]
MVYDDITELIGDTPLLKLDARVHRLEHVELYAKLEMFNPFGSVKDRVAWAMVKDDLDGIVDKRQTFIEASSGNTAKALQVLAATRGLRLAAYTNRVRVTEVREVLHLLGAEVHELPGLSECPDPTAPNDVFSTIGAVMATDPGAYYRPSQYTNLKNVEAHFRGTGKEIYDDIGPVDYLVGGLGTTGSTRGAATYLKEHNPKLATIGVVSSRADFIPGIRSEAEMWEVGLFQPDVYTEIVPVDSGVAIDATLELVTRYGVLAGPTSGATYAAALDVLRRRAGAAGDRPVKAVILVCDRLEPYLSYFRKRRPELFGRAKGRSLRDLAPAEVAGTPEITPDDLEALDGQQVLKIDTRGSMAYRIGHVPGSVNIRDDYLVDMLSQGLPFPTSTKLIFICPVGELSKRLAAFTRQAGYDAASLAGGIVAWRDAGKPLESSPRG